MELTILHDDPGSTAHLESDDELVRGITDYQRGGWEGSGTLIAVDKNGTWYSYSCGHCSCYGPLDSAKSGRFSKEEIQTLYPQFTEFINKND